MKDKLVGFAVTEMDVNPDELLVLPVKKIDEYANYNYDLTVIIVLPELIAFIFPFSLTTATLGLLDIY